MNFIAKALAAVFAFVVGFAMLKYYGAPTWGAMIGGWVLVCTLKYWD